MLRYLTCRAAHDIVPVKDVYLVIVPGGGGLAAALPQHEGDADDLLGLGQVAEHQGPHLGQAVAEGGLDVRICVLVKYKKSFYFSPRAIKKGDVCSCYHQIKTTEETNISETLPIIHFYKRLLLLTVYAYYRYMKTGKNCVMLAKKIIPSVFL
jgi:hypothetical protein